MPQCADLAMSRFGFEACDSCVLVGVLLVLRCWRNAPYMRVTRSSLHKEELGSIGPALGLGTLVSSVCGYDL